MGDAKRSEGDDEGDRDRFIGKKKCVEFLRKKERGKKMESSALHTLVPALQGLDDTQRALLQARVMPLLASAEKKGRAAERLDTGLFLGGFCVSLVVTIATAINLAGYVTPTAASAVGTAILVLSSLATGTLGLRERLRLKETSIISKRCCSFLQKALVLFAARAGPYSQPDSSAAFKAFISDVEVLKGLTDQAFTRLQEDTSASTSTSVPSGAPSAAAIAPAAATGTHDTAVTIA